MFFPTDLNRGVRDCEYQVTPLHIACISGNVQVVRTLLDNAIEYGIHTEAEGPQQLLPLHVSIMCFPSLPWSDEPYFISSSALMNKKVKNKAEVVKLLLNHEVVRAKTNYNASCSIGRNAFHFACFFGQTEIVDLLVSNAWKLGIDLYARDSLGKKPSDYCSHKDIVKAFPILNRDRRLSL